MTFKRPQNISLTEMAQWVDNNCYAVDRDDEKLVTYLYHLVYSRAQQSHLFTDYDMCDDFSLYCVSKFFIRFSNTGEAPVKSVVNYLKTVLEPWKAEYIREFCVGSSELNIADFHVNDFCEYLIDVSSEYDYTNYCFTCDGVSDVVRQYLKKIPHKKNSAEWSNIYISCMLTLEDRMNTAAKLAQDKHLKNDPQGMNRILRQLKTRPPVLFHIEEQRGPYISVLVNELIHAIAAELSHTIHSKVSPHACLQNMIAAANNNEDES